MEYLLQNNEMLFYFIQNFPTIEEIVKRNFSGGILASQMIQIIYKSFIKYKNELLVPESDNYNLLSSLATQELINKIKDRTQNGNLESAIYNNFDKFPSQEQINKFTKNPEKYVEDINKIAINNKDNLTIDKVTPLIEMYNDINLYDPYGNDPTINQLEDEIADIINNQVDFITGTSKQNVKKTEFLKPKAVAPVLLTKETIQEKILERSQREREARARLEREKKMKEAGQKISKVVKIKKEEKLRKKAQAEAEAEAIKKAQAEAQAQTAPQQVEQFGTGLLDNREKNIHRFKVLKGELIAGNTNRNIIKELKSLVVKMIKYNELEPPQALSILKELNNIK